MPKSSRAGGGLRGVLAFYRLSRDLRGADLPSGLTWERLSALSAVTEFEPISISDLSQLERVGQPTMSRTVAALKRSALVRCLDNRQDGRSVLVRSTAKGRSAVDIGLARSLEQLADLLQKANVEELEALADLIRAGRSSKQT